MKKKKIVQKSVVVVAEARKIVPLFKKALENVRDDARDNPYLEEAMRVLPAGGYRSAIGSVWNAVVDDLRNKIIHRSVELFNQSVNLQQKVAKYEDFQSHVSDDLLIEGAYKTGVIGWEASKILKQVKEARHIFYGHPKSTEPSLVKVLSVVEDCVKYVLSEPYPSQIIDISVYLSQMATDTYDRNSIGIENALSDLPEVYKGELANRLFSAYINEGSSSTLRSNIEFSAPILWSFLDKSIKQQVVRRIDQEISSANVNRIKWAFDFTSHVDGQRFLTVRSRVYKIAPLVRALAKAQDNWEKENDIVRELVLYAGHIPESLIDAYVRALTMTYVGYTGGSPRFSRTDFYADGAAMRIPKMFQAFDDKAAAAFITALRGNAELRTRIKSPAKMSRLRTLGRIVLEKVSSRFDDVEILRALIDPDLERRFITLLDKRA